MFATRLQPGPFADPAFQAAFQKMYGICGLEAVQEIAERVRTAFQGTLTFLGLQTIAGEIYPNPVFRIEVGQGRSVDVEQAPLHFRQRDGYTTVPLQVPSSNDVTTQETLLYLKQTSTTVFLGREKSLVSDEKPAPQKNQIDIPPRTPINRSRSLATLNVVEARSRTSEAPPPPPEEIKIELSEASPPPVEGLSNPVAPPVDSSEEAGAGALPPIDEGWVEVQEEKEETERGEPSGCGSDWETG